MAEVQSRAPRSKEKARPGTPDEFAFVAFLDRRFALSPPAQKSARTRERLKIAAARLLESNGYHDMSASAVSVAAGVAEGSFYMYFRDKDDVTRTVLDEFVDHFLRPYLASSGRPAATAFEAVRNSNNIWLRIAQANPGLFRCMLQFADEIPDFAAKMQQANFDWHLRVVRAATSRGNDAEMMLLVYLLGGMMDDLVRKLVVYPDRQLRQVLEQLDAGHETLVDIVTLLWMRVLHPSAHVPGELSKAAGVVASLLFGGGARQKR